MKFSYIFNLVVLDTDPDQRIPKHERVLVCTFLSTTQSAEKSEEQAREAVEEYLTTSAGKRDIEFNHGHFNWGDALCCVPKAMWEKHGLRPYRYGDADTVVDHNEILNEEF